MTEECKIRSDQVKRTIRNLKKAEIRIRTQHYYDADSAKKQLVWDDFFDLKHGENVNAKYTLEQLMEMSRQEYKDVEQEFYWNVYYRIYKNSYYSKAACEIDSFARLNLSPLADIEEIKSKFRQLAKKYHPDAGGSSEEFIEIYRIYKELKGR